MGPYRRQFWFRGVKVNSIKLLNIFELFMFHWRTIETLQILSFRNPGFIGGAVPKKTYILNGHMSRNVILFMLYANFRKL